MKTIRSLLKEKGNAVWSTTPEASVFEALRLMAEKDVGALVVLDGEKLAGIFSERDYARKVILRGRSSKEMKVKEIMTTEVVTVKPTHTITEALAVMARKHIRHLPVLEEGQLIGVVSIGDVVQSIISEQENNLQRLEDAMIGKEFE